MDAGLYFHSFGRQPSWTFPYGEKPACGFCRERTVARGRLDLCALGQPVHRLQGRLEDDSARHTAAASLPHLRARALRGAPAAQGPQTHAARRPAHDRHHRLSGLFLQLLPAKHGRQPPERLGLLAPGRDEPHLHPGARLPVPQGTAHRRQARLRGRVHGGRRAHRGGGWPGRSRRRRAHARRVRAHLARAGSRGRGRRFILPC